MTVDFNLLDPQFKEKIEKFLDVCKENQLDVRPNSGYRSLEEQAKLWRRSRPTYLIQQEIGKLKMQGCEFLASIIEKVGPQPTAKWATDSIPGLSWHNWGKALDSLIFVNNKLIENGEAYCYQVYHQLAKKMEIYNIGTRDAGHLQMNQKSVKDTLSLIEINDYFKDKT